VSTALTLTHILLFGLYAFMVLAHTWLQERVRRRNTPVRADHDKERLPHIWERPPRVDVVVPIYNEQPDVLAACLASLDRQDYNGEIRFLVVDDGSSNFASLVPTYRHYARQPNWSILRWPDSGNRGKRLAQQAAIYGSRGDGTLLQLDLDGLTRSVTWEKSKADLIVMVDSDTVVRPDGVSWILTPFLDDEVAAVTGDVAVLNHAVNRLTRLIGVRYGLLFRHERAAQSRHGLVYCCAGPFSAYRLQDLDRDWPDYVGQRFGGKPCTYGDDLQLTHLVLRRGRRSIYQPKARASTIVPTTLKAYVRQQWRWNRSFYRQFRWIVPLLRANRNPYQVFDLVARTAPSLLLAVAFAIAMLDMARLGIGSFPVALATVGGMLLTGFSSVLWQTRNPGFALLYGMIYVGLLLPIRLWALCTLRDDRWGTRALVERAFARRHSQTVSGELPTTSVGLGGPSEQSGSSPVPDLVTLFFEQGSRPIQFVDGFAAAATEQQHLG
jgi:N-acetylglucosaminyltransferase